MSIGPIDSEMITREELQLAARNHGMPLEALRYPITPVGLHYLLTHYDIPAVDPAEWRLDIGGLVDKPLALSLDDIEAMPATSLAVTMECAGNGRTALSPRPVSQPWILEAVGTGQWRGASLRDVLTKTAPRAEAREVVFTGLDHGLEGGIEQDYQRALSVEDANRGEVLLAYELNGAALPPQHGFPLRLVVPGWYGMTSVKWLKSIELTSEPFAGYQQDHSYRLRQSPEETGTPITRIVPRSLMMPPGFPEFLSRRRIVNQVPCTIQGRAWSGWGAITSVEVSADGGRLWAPARLEKPEASRWAWRGWTYEWNPATAGEYELCCRARDDAGNVQPLDVPWTTGGYSNNAVQRVKVTVDLP
jgi:sulfane dehydrogenase subunit SoxC